MSDKLLKKAVNKHKSGQSREAQSLYKKILKSQPQHIDANYMLGTLYAEQGDINNALKYLSNAERLAPRSQYIKNNLGNIYRMRGDYDTAALKYQEALTFQPDMIEAQNNLAIVQRRLNNTRQAIMLYKNAIALSPDFAEAHFNLGKAYWDEQQYEDAKACFTRVLEINPLHARAWHELGNYHLKHNNKAPAIECFEKYLSLTKDDECGARLKLSYLNAGELPQRQPEQLVRQTYEKKARTWDADVDRADMAFLGPQLVRDALRQMIPDAENLTVLDVGCGTGLCAPFLKPVAKRLHGVDLSEHMLDIARRKQCYDDLFCDDIIRYLTNTGEVYDLVTGSGVLIFFGELSVMFTAVRQRLSQGGYFIFTLYKSNDADIEIRDNMHFAHSERYIRALAAQSGFKAVDIEPVVHEYEHDQPQPGFIVILQK
ncbi:MAG: tetratricopeptide repeat protein [Gammaproteobacteria bacterium]|nr:tetratricopeptide repeat protein [Gammaproteobacteria bacterium]